jgi:hypothetical protein
MPNPDPDHEKHACMVLSHLPAGSIRIETDDRRAHCFATGHYVDGVIEANANAAKTTDSPERLTLRFSSGEVIILGKALDCIEDRLAEGRLRILRRLSPRYGAVLKHGPFIFSITVNRKDPL